jgi:hypothetical protein
LRPPGRLQRALLGFVLGVQPDGALQIQPGLRRPGWVQAPGLATAGWAALAAPWQRSSRRA